MFIEMLKPEDNVTTSTSTHPLNQNILSQGTTSPLHGVKQDLQLKQDPLVMMNAVQTCTTMLGVSQGHYLIIIHQGRL